MRVREMFPSGFLATEDLVGKDVTLTIAKVQREKLRANAGEEEREKWTLRFVEMERRTELVDRKALCLNKTNAKAIAKLHGQNADDWSGKRITLYPTTCKAFGETVPCIRVRDKVPATGRGKTRAVEADAAQSVTTDSEPLTPDTSDPFDGPHSVPVGPGEDDERGAVTRG